MDWLEKHLRYFILPKLQCVLGLNDRAGPFKGTLRADKAAEFKEGGMLLTFIKSCRGLGELDYDTRRAFSCFAVKNGEEGHSELHTRENISHLSHNAIVHTTIKNSVKDLIKQTKQTDKTVFLLGRDVWLWAVIGEKMGLRYRYDPRVSRNVVRQEALIKDLVTAHGIKDGDIVFDTGFGGTIHYGVEDSLNHRERQRSWMRTDSIFHLSQKPRI